LPFRNTKLRYGSVAMSFHWLIAVLVIVNLCLGFYAANMLDDNDLNYFPIIQLHKSIGLTVLVLSVLRLGWRLINPIPPLPSDFGPTMRLLAHASHFLFYFFIIAVPLLGWMMVSASARGTPTIYFGLYQWPHIPWLAELPRADKRAFSGLFHESHAILAYSALALAVVHIAAALWHQFIRRDTVLRRMLPGTKVTSA
jgi:cytochrome b561